MLKNRRPGVILALGSVFALVTGGVAAAAPVSQEKVTADKQYRLTLSIDDVNIQSVPNMAAAPLIREGFVTAAVKFTVECLLPAGDCKLGQEIRTANVTAFAQVGCAVQLDPTKGIALGPSGQITAGLPNTLGGLLPEGGDITNIGITPTLSGLTPGSLAVTIKPGYITDQELATQGFIIDPRKAEHTKSGSVSVINRHIVVDQATAKIEHPPTCLGPVTVRIRAVGLLITKTTSDQIDMYGNLYTL